MARIPTAPVAASGLIGGYLLARTTNVRPLGAVPLAAGGAWSAMQWHKNAGLPATAVLLGVYLGGFVASHPLARRIGTWPSVLTVSGISGLASWVLADRRRGAGVLERASGSRAGR